MSSRRLRERGEDGVISVVMALSMALFVALLAVVVDLGQLWAAKAALDGATSSAAVEAAGILAREGCDGFATASAAAADAVDASAPGASLERLEVVYGATTVEAVGDCAALPGGTDQDVGRVVVVASATREAAFAGAFTEGTLVTRAESQAEWGYVAAFNGGLRPLSLCTLHDAWDGSDGDGYLAYLADLDAGDPTDPADLRFRIEVDADDGSPCPKHDTLTKAGSLPHVDWSPTQAATAAGLVDWLVEGAPYRVVVDDRSTTADDPFCQRDVLPLAPCRPGVSRTIAPTAAEPWRPALGQVFPIGLHERAVCLRNGCNGRPEHRGYPLTGVARVRLLCVGRAGTATIRADDLTVDEAAECAVIETTAGSDLWAVFEFVVGAAADGGRLTISEGELDDVELDPDARYLGVSVCSVDGDGTCSF